MSNAREQWHKLVDNILDDAEKKGLCVNRMPLQLWQARISGKGKKAVLVASFDMVLNLSSFKGGEHNAVNAIMDGRDYGVILAVHKKHLADFPDEEDKPA